VNGPPFIDTSALAKWYLPEARSDELEAWVQEHAPVAISSVTLVELRSLLARRRRIGELDPGQEDRVFATFEEDLMAGNLRLVPPEAEDMRSAADLIARCRAPLRSLDAIHLATALRLGAPLLATADRVQAAAALELEIALVWFGLGQPPPAP
jgi:predicted nucleic acid-binding protein